MIAKTLIGKSYTPDILIYEYNGKGRRKDTFIPGTDPQFLRIEDKVLICSGKHNVIIDSDALVCHGIDIYWEREKRSLAGSSNRS